MDIQLAKEVMDVVTHRRETDEQRIRDALAIAALREQPKHFVFASRQRVALRNIRAAGGVLANAQMRPRSNA